MVTIRISALYWQRPINKNIHRETPFQNSLSIPVQAWFSSSRNILGHLELWTFVSMRFMGQISWGNLTWYFCTNPLAATTLVKYSFIGTWGVFSKATVPRVLLGPKSNTARGLLKSYTSECVRSNIMYEAWADVAWVHRRVKRIRPLTSSKSEPVSWPERSSSI